jgi:predicted glycosyltransferase
MFKHFIREAEKLGNEVLVTATRKDIALELLNEYGIAYTDMGSYGKGLLSKALNIIPKDIHMLNIVRKFKPDVLMGLASHRIAHAATVLGGKVYIFDDTEHADLEIMLYKPFATKIFTPSCFKRDIGSKQIRYPGYHELAYLHPIRFVPDTNILREVGVTPGEVYSVVRFVSWEAGHDRGVAGIGLEQKREAIMMLAKFGKVFVSSEKPLPGDLEQYRLKLSPGKVHHLMNFASLIYGESATMASEAAVLGVHAIFCDPFGRGYTTEEEERYGLVFNFQLDKESIARSIHKAEELLSDPQLHQKGQEKQVKLLSEKIDVTAFMLKEVLQ